MKALLTRGYHAGHNHFRFLVYLFTIGFALAVASPLYATSYYISPSGNDSNSGTSPSEPWQTIIKVNSTTFSPGDRILFQAGGTWSGQLWPQGSGADGKPIVINKYGKGAKPIINGPGTNGSAGVLIQDQSYWEINNLEVTNTQPTNGPNDLLGIFVTSTSLTILRHHIYVKNCYVHDVNSVAYGNDYPNPGPNYDKVTGGILYLISIKDALVQGNTVRNVSSEGIRNASFPTTSGFVIRNNLVENVYGDGIVITGSIGGSIIEYNVVHNACMTDQANYAALWTADDTHTLVQYNEVYGTTAGGPYDGEAFDADTDADGDIFQYNYTHDNARGFMLFLYSAINIVVRYNVSQNDATGVSPLGGGHRLFLQVDAGSSSNQIYNNTFYEGNLDTVFWNDTNMNMTFNNNILYSTGTVTQFSTTPINSSSEFENNDFYPASIIAVNGPAGTVLNNITLDPLFTAPGTGGVGMSFGKNGFATEPTGYQLQSGSPALNAGMVISNNGGFDYFGNTVSPSEAPNIGSYNGAPFSTLDAVIELIGTPATTFVAGGRFTLGAKSNGINPLTETVILQLGGYHIAIPPTLFVKSNGNYLYNGKIGNVSAEMVIRPVAANVFLFGIAATGAAGLPKAYPVQLTLTIGDDTGTEQIKAGYSGPAPTQAEICKDFNLDCSK